MKTQSAKAKGRLLQQKVRDTILGLHKTFRANDVKSTSMGAGGKTFSCLLLFETAYLSALSASPMPK